MAVPVALARLIWRRANGRCEYCRTPEAFDGLRYEIDHIIARKHRGPTSAGNLAFSCFYCNAFKGADLAGLDPRTRRLTPLFNPRRQSWDQHFRWDGAVQLGRTAIGRTTVVVLNVNEPMRVELRARLIADGLFPAD